MYITLINSCYLHRFEDQLRRQIAELNESRPEDIHSK